MSKTKPDEDETSKPSKAEKAENKDLSKEPYPTGSPPDPEEELKRLYPERYKEPEAAEPEPAKKRK